LASYDMKHGSDELLKSSAVQVDAWHPVWYFTLQHVFTCWASTVPQEVLVVKLWLCVIGGWWEAFYSIKQQSSVGTE
jgi:hypothetical protein